MKLKNILGKQGVEKTIGNLSVEIDNLSQDTREEFTGKTLYFAVRGTKVDGHYFIKQAIEKGAVAVVCEEIPNKVQNEKIVFILVDVVSDVMGQMISNFYENPSEKLKVIAVTGTNGKTTIATLLYQALLVLGENAAIFSTAGDFINGKEIKTNKKASSSMEIIELHKNLKLALDQCCSYVCLEATSHALDQNRLNGVKIAGAIFTNLSQDHLDYHESFEHYAMSKKKLFDMLEEGSFSLVNIDDTHAAKMVSETRSRIISYGDVSFANSISRDLLFEVEGFSFKGTELSLDGHPARILLVGKFNMYNILAVYGTLRGFGFNIDKILKSIAKIKGARGRMELVVGKGEGVVGIVDYAHTPDALENVLQTLGELPHEKIITVVGVGGDRDREKRPQMARIAQEGSDYAIYTSDNPRTEDPKQIFSDLLSGCDTSIENYEKLEDREEAIKRAVAIAQDGDIILVAGKGHEDYQIIGTEKIHFDDREVLEKYL